MLVLSRKENESIEFPSLGVVIRVIGMTRRRVQLGIDAPISLKVTRGEMPDENGVPVQSVDSIAEHVIGEEFNRLASEMSALAELANPEDQRLARQVAADLIERTERIQRAVSASLRGRDKKSADDLRKTSSQKHETWTQSEPDSAYVRQPPVGYAVSPLPPEATRRPGPLKRNCVIA